ncbi:MAG: helix-turn-helix domain-containing protein [Candidatus Micrarchaeia archaeon]
MEKFAVRIAGEIALSDTPGKTMKKWREIFEITQAELGEYLKISPSTISDYEADRRESPGIKVIRRFVDALIEIDAARGGQISQRFREEKGSGIFFETHEFATSITGESFAKMIEGKVVVNEEVMPEKKLYGFTLLDSIRVIIEMPYSEFPKLFGASPERAFIFTKVTTGRSPMVVVRVSQMKPSVVVLHRINTVDKLAVKIAQKERIPIVTTKLSINELLERLKKL